MTPMLRELDSYYRKRGIHSKEFWCCCQGECKFKVLRFTEAKSAFVGTRYEDGSLPRLLFLGSDPGEGKEWPNREQRSPAAIQKRIESVPPQGNERQALGTLLFALRILSNFNPAMRQLWSEILFDSGDCRLWGENLLGRWRTKLHKLVAPYLAHANAVRCSVNAKGRQEAPQKLYDNCRRYLHGEIEVLEPHIIVTQGDKAREALAGNGRRDSAPCFKEAWDGSKCQRVDNQPPCNPTCIDRCKIVRLGDRKVLWIHTYHPSYRKRLFEKEGGPSWNCYAAAAEAFMNREHPQ